MQIPRQLDGTRGACGVAADAADGLRARRRRLVRELRTVAYWQRLVQARTDLCVAGLLYAAPVPASPSPLVTTGPARPALPGGHSADDVDLAGLAAPPAGLDLERLLGGHEVCASSGAHLDRLREASSGLRHRSRALQQELDVVTLALHARLARDGAQAGTTGVAGVGTGTVARHPA